MAILLLATKRGCLRPSSALLHSVHQRELAQALLAIRHHEYVILLVPLCGSSNRSHVTDVLLGSFILQILRS